MSLGDDGRPSAGTKELIAVRDGYRESNESWSSVLRDLSRRGMKKPILAVADGALGFWSALRHVWPETKEQCCGFHWLGNVIDKLPKKIQPKATRMLHQRLDADPRKCSEELIEAFCKESSSKYDRAVDCLLKDQDAMLAFFDFPPGSLEASENDERHRVELHHHTSSSTRYERRRLTHGWIGDGFQASEDT